MSDLLVVTSSGAVRGVAGPHGTEFRDIPYAAPPVGSLRFAEPELHASWVGVRDATQPGPTAPQPPRGRFGRLDVSPFFGRGWQRGDDYLTLTLWAPEPGPEAAPVIVFVHGGAFIAGSTNAPVYDGESFARDGVLLVTVNYRLGIPGFLHLDDAPDNRGRLDVIAALRWVRENIAAFGGDPLNVTLAGQSAGAIIVASILADAAADGLLRRGIVASGSGVGAFLPEQAQLITGAVGRELGIAPTATSLADIDDERLIEVIPRLTGTDIGTTSAHDPLGGITPFGLVQDEQPADALARRTETPDLLTGSNLDESSLYFPPLEVTGERDLIDAAARFRRPSALIATYREARPTASAGQLRSAIYGDGLFGFGTRHYAEAHSRTGTSTFVYEFGWRSNALDGRLGASHLIELPFVFERTGLAGLHGPEALLGTEPPPEALVTQMHATWVRFARDGDPGWPSFRADRQLVRQIGTETRDTEGLHASEYLAWQVTS